MSKEHIRGIRVMKKDLSKHANLECPECGSVCTPRHEHKDGSVTYICRKPSLHADSRDLKFVIDAEGELHF